MCCITFKNNLKKLPGFINEGRMILPALERTRGREKGCTGRAGDIWVEFTLAAPEFTAELESDIVPPVRERFFSQNDANFFAVVWYFNLSAWNEAIICRSFCSVAVSVIGSQGGLKRFDSIGGGGSNSDSGRVLCRRAALLCRSLEKNGVPSFFFSSISCFRQIWFIFSKMSTSDFPEKKNIQ